MKGIVFMAENVDFQDVIIQRIKKLRENEGITQAKLSEILGISRGQLSNIENPNYPHKYTIRQIEKLCDTVKYPIEKIFIPEIEITPECSRVIKEMIESVIRYE